MKFLYLILSAFLYIPSAFSTEKIFLYSIFLDNGSVGENLNIAIPFQKTLKSIYGARFKTIADLKAVDGAYKASAELIREAEWFASVGLTDDIPGKLTPFKEVKQTLLASDSGLLIVTLSAHGTMSGDQKISLASPHLESDIFDIVERYASIMDRIVLVIDVCFGGRILREMNQHKLEEIAQKTGCQIAIISVANRHIMADAVAAYNILSSSLEKVGRSSVSFDEFYHDLKLMELGPYKTTYLPSASQIPRHVVLETITGTDINLFKTSNFSDFLLFAVGGRSREGIQVEHINQIKHLAEKVQNETQNYLYELNRFSSLFSKEDPPDFYRDFLENQNHTVQHLFEQRRAFSLAKAKHATPLAGDRNFLQYAYIHFPGADIRETSSQFSDSLVTEDLVLKHFHHTKDIATRDPKYALATQMNHFLNTLTTYHGKKNGDAPQVFQALSDATRSPNIIHQALGQVFLRFSGQSVNKSLETLMKDTSYFVSALFFPFVDMLYPDFPDDSAWLSKLKILLNDGHGNEAKRVIKPINKLHNNITFKAKALTLIFRHPRSFFEARTQILTSLMKIAGIQDASIDEQLKLGIKKAFKHFTDGQSVSGYENGLTADGSLLNFSEPLVLWHMLGYGIEQGYSYCALHDELYR